ncbi:MAG: hypothetical protein Q9224_002791, partial [Gallowayella concinna]
MAALGQTIAVVDRSGKVVSTSKHLVNVFKEAKAAYREKKAEIVAGRQSELEEKRARRALKAGTFDDDRSSRASSRTKNSHQRPTAPRYYSESAAINEVRSMTSPPTSPRHREFDHAPAPSSPRTLLARRHTDYDGAPLSPSLSRSMSSPCQIDMDLAYGDIPPPLDVAPRAEEEVELRGLVHRVKMVLEEAECLQYSATAIIASLQKNPDAMAAVALTLAEISNIISKMAPGALVALKGSSPAVFALLASPQFMIAAGVGVGITVVALGGYKIIKKIKAKHAEEDPGMDELLEIGGDVSNIDNWRRGIAEAQAGSVGTSVDGEFITPQAAALSRLNLNERIETTSRHRSSKKSSSERGSSRSSKDDKEGHSKHSKHSKSRKEKGDKGEKKGDRKEKKPSPLRLMFHSYSRIFGKIPPSHASQLRKTIKQTLELKPPCRSKFFELSALILASMTDGSEIHDNSQISTPSGVADSHGSNGEPNGINARGLDLEGREYVSKSIDSRNSPTGKSSNMQGSMDCSEVQNIDPLESHYHNHDDQQYGQPRNNLDPGGLGEEEEEDDRVANEKVLKLSPAQIRELMSSPDSLPPVAPAFTSTISTNGSARRSAQVRKASQVSGHSPKTNPKQSHFSHPFQTPNRIHQSQHERERILTPAGASTTEDADGAPSSRKESEVLTTPPLSRQNSSKVSLFAQNNIRSSRKSSRSTPRPLHLDERKLGPRHAAPDEPMPSPMPQSIPIPPYSFPTFLHLELSSRKPSALYIHRSRVSDFPYESSRVKMDRLRNFWGVWATLEWTLLFGFLACLDAWLYSFTILPLRFLIAVGMLVQSWFRNLYSELKFIGHSLYSGPGRVWRRRRASSATMPSLPSVSDILSATASTTQAGSPLPKSAQFSFPSETDNLTSEHTRSEPPRKRRKDGYRKHRRAKSMPSRLGPENKADLVRGSLILFSCVILMQFDASRMYHGIRGQAAIKLYVIYNVLDVCDRLFSALGQDILECLISKEALERKPDGRSKVIQPFWLFIAALAYNMFHSTALFIQVITLNVAVNSYSNALSTLLMSAQFVEIKSTVFKKFEKENLFQLTCADIVERFQLWLMLTIIALRNLIEIGGLGSSPSSGTSSPSSSPTSNSTAWPKSFTMLPQLTSVLPEWTGLFWYLFQPMLLVFVTEMVVDNIKHAFITKFNNTKPAIYGRFHDILAKDYYTNAFAEQNLTRRLGLPVIPLSCLFIRASLQSYHMALATWLPPPIPSTATSLSVDPTTTNPTTTAALHHIDHL